MMHDVVVAALALGALSSLVILVILAVLLLWPSVRLARIERQVGALRSEVDGYRATHENQMESLDRRLLGLEQTAAQAANELRMASGEIMGRLAVTLPAGGEGA